MELKEQIDGLGKDWADFKKTNGELLAAKADGKAVAALEEKLAKLNSSIEEKTAAMAKLETAFKRTNFGTEQKPGMTEEAVAHRKAFNEYLRKGKEDGLREMEQKALSVGDDAQGGYTVNADLSGRITKRVFETSPIRLYANVQTITTDALEGIVDANEADAGWAGETEPRYEMTTPQIGKWRIPTHEVYARPKATQKVLDDSAWDMESWLTGKVADKIARKENNAFVLGDGEGKPKGFLAYGAVADSASANFFALKKLGFIKTGKANDFPDAPSAGTDPGVADPLINLVYALKTEYRERAGTAFGMHRTTLARVRRLRDNHGQYLWQPSLIIGQPATILGYPVAEFNDMPQLGDTNKYAIGFGNWAESYQIVDRMGVRVLRDPFSSKPYVEFYTAKRVGGDVVNFEALKLLSFTA